jgi:hypothetical protein
MNKTVEFKVGDKVRYAYPDAFCPLKALVGEVLNITAIHTNYQNFPIDVTIDGSKTYCVELSELEFLD